MGLSGGPSEAGRAAEAQRELTSSAQAAGSRAAAASELDPAADSRWELAVRTWSLKPRPGPAEPMPGLPAQAPPTPRPSPTAAPGLPRQLRAWERERSWGPVQIRRLRARRHRVPGWTPWTPAVPVGT